jgi:hypothetical protein
VVLVTLGGMRKASDKARHPEPPADPKKVERPVPDMATVKTKKQRVG